MKEALMAAFEQELGRAYLQIDPSEVFDLNRPNLLHLAKKHVRAWNNVSHSPEVRLVRFIIDHSLEMQAVLAKLEQAGWDDASQVSFVQTYTTKCEAYLYAKSRCISSMITGPARFPTRTADKANNSADRRYQELQDYVSKVQRSVDRKKKQEAIAAQGGEIGIARTRLQRLIEEKEFSLKLNKDLRACKPSHPGAIDRMVAKGYTEQEAIRFIEDGPVPGCHLTNLNDSIKRAQKRVELLESMEAHKDAEHETVTFEGLEVIFNKAVNRIQLQFDGKPDEKTRAQLKSMGFKWAPSAGVWQNYMNRNTTAKLRIFLQENGYTQNTKA